MEHYLALFEPDLKAGGYVVAFPDFGYGVTQGESDEETMSMAQELLMLDRGLHPGRQTITCGGPPPWSQVPSSAAAGVAVRQGRPL